MIEIVNGITDRNMWHEDKVYFATQAFLDAIESEALGQRMFYAEEDNLYGKVYNETRRILRDHAKGCDCMDCERIEQ